MILSQWLPDEILQAIAAENNLADTAFVVPHQGEFRLRWFTPEVDVDLCRHATLASAHVLFRHGYAAPPDIVFQYRGGTLTVTQEGELLAMRFPARPPQRVQCDTAIVAALGAKPREVHRARDLLAVFDTQQEVEGLRPDFQAIALLDTFAVIALAPGKDCDFVSRFFAPGAASPRILSRVRPIAHSCRIGASAWARRRCMRCNSLAAEASCSAKTRESGCRSLVVQSSISEGTSSSEALVREAPTKALQATASGRA